MTTEFQNLDYHKEWLHNLAYVFLVFNHVEKSIKLWEALDCLNTNDPRLLLSLSYAYLENHNYEKAISYWNEGTFW